MDSDGDRVLVDVFLEAHRRAPRQTILEIGATDDPIQRQSRKSASLMATTLIYPCTFSAASSCWERDLRSSNMDASEGALDELKRIIAQIRQK
jgi:hypothetical protein